MTDPRIQEALAASRTLHAAGHTKEARRAEKRVEALLLARHRERFRAQQHEGETVWLGIEVSVEP